MPIYLFISFVFIIIQKRALWDFVQEFTQI